MVNKISKILDNYILFDNGVIIQTYLIDKKRLKITNSEVIYTFEDFKSYAPFEKVTIVRKAIAMSDSFAELNSFYEKISV